MRWWKKFTALPDLGGWHRHILKQEELLKTQREQAPESPYDSEAHDEAKDYLKRRKIPIKALRLEGEK